MSTTCTKCKLRKVSRSIEGHRLAYQCQSCSYNWTQPFLEDSEIKIISTSQGIKHIIIAALIRYNDKILFVEQDEYPSKLELPANHLCKDDTLEHTLERTIDELLGVEISASRLLNQIELPFRLCPYGADAEEWAIFDVEINENDLVASNPTRLIAWVPLDHLATKNLTEETIYMLECLGYLKAPKRRERKP